MKLVTLIVTALLTTALSAQTTVTVTTGVGNATQTFYSLQNGVQTSAPNAEWDLAFEISGFSGSILANTAKGMQVYKAPFSVAQWASVDTAGLAATWSQQHNSEISWSAGALNQGLTEDEFDLGWGVYNMITHTVLGDSVFVVKLVNGDWKKLRIDGLATSTYMFTWANLDGSNEQTGSLNKTLYVGKNFGYFSLENNIAQDREPATTAWDLVFTKYIAFVPTAYGVAGALQNKNTQVLQVDGVDPAIAEWWDDEFSADINTIGYDWKTFNMTTFEYEYPLDRTYFVQDQLGNVWKLIYTGYGGSATGDMTFTQELVSATSVEENATQGTVVVYPNPVANGQAQLLVNVPSGRVVATVHDLSGKLVRQQLLTGLNGLSLRTIDVNGLQQGLYVVRLEGNGVSTTTRLVIE